MSSWACGALIATWLARSGLRRQKLSHSGAAAAWCVGFLSLGALPRAGLAMLVFYASGSFFTKHGAETKKLLDAEYKEAGNRSAGQVLSCSAIATALSLVHCLCYGSAADGPIFIYSPDLHRAILLAIAAHYSACAADTWASELGILSPSSPILITNFKPVPAGTNGGITSAGMIASAAGGACVGLTMFLSLFFVAPFTGPFVGAGNRMETPLDLYNELYIIPFCTGFGLLGSLLDSLLGATLQITIYDEHTNRIVSTQSTSTRIIAGYDILSNQQVNLVSVALTTVVGAMSVIFTVPRYW